MAHFLCMAWSSNPHFCVTYLVGVPFVTCCNTDGVDQIVVSKSIVFYKLLIQELYVTPLDGHLVRKLTQALFQRVWLPKLHEILTSFACLYMTYL